MQASDKTLLRRKVRALFDANLRDAESALICRHVLDWEVYRSARVIGGYMPMKHEADITPVLLDALASGKTLALPLCGKPPEMSFRRVENLDQLRTGAYGLLEPMEDAPVMTPEEIDLLLTPLEAVDHRGMRLGKGGGYYDRLLTEHALCTVGMALSWQWVEEVPAQAWDQPLRAAGDRSGVRWF